MLGPLRLHQPPLDSPFPVERNVRLLQAYSFAVSFQLWMAIWVVYLTDFRGVSLFFVGLLETFFQAINVLGVVPAGAFADRFGRKPALALGVFIEATGLSLFAFADNFPMILLSYLLWASGGTLRDPAASAYLYDSLAADGRQGEFSRLFGRFTALMSAGFLVGGVIGSPIASIFTLQAPVALSALSYSVALALVLALREPPRSFTSALPMTYWQTVRTGGRVVRDDRAIRFLVLVTFGMAFAASANVILMQPFMNRHAVPIGLFGIILVPFRLASMVAAMQAYVFERVLGFRRAFVLIAIAPIFLLVLVASVDHVAMLIAIGMIGVLGMARQPLVADYLNRRTGSETRATVLALRRFSSSVVMSLGAPLAGALAEGSLRLAFLVLAVATALVAIPSLLLWLRADRNAPPLLDATPRLEEAEVRAGDEG